MHAGVRLHDSRCAWSARSGFSDLNREANDWTSRARAHPGICVRNERERERKRMDVSCVCIARRLRRFEKRMTSKTKGKKVVNPRFGLLQKSKACVLTG